MLIKLNKNTIRGDIAKHPIGTQGTVCFPNKIYTNVVIKNVVSSYTDEYLDDYYVIDLPDRPDTWVVMSEFTTDAKLCLHCKETSSPNRVELCNLCINHETGKPCKEAYCPSMECNGTKLIQDFKE